MKKRNKIYTVLFLLFFTTSLMLVTIRSEDPIITTLWEEQFDDITRWQIYPGKEDYHSLDSYTDQSNGYMYVYEDTGHVSTPGFAVDTFDLSSWSKTSDLEIQFRFRAQSDNYLQLADPLTNFRIGIKNYALQTLWSYGENFPSVSDSGWLERTEIVIPKEEFDSEDCSELLLYVGYYDSWGNNWEQQVDVDYITLEGEETTEVISNPIELLVEENFNYDEEVFLSYWFLPEEVQEHHTLLLDGDYATVQEGTGELYTDVFVYGLLDLNSWTGLTDMTIKYKVRVKSDYDAGSVTNYVIGIRTLNGEIKWSQEEDFELEDTGWKDRSFTLSEEDFQVSGTYVLYWGYIDHWEHDDHDQEVKLDYFKVYGEKKPEGYLVNNKAGITTKAEVHELYFDNAYDPDDVFISYASKADFSNSLGLEVILIHSSQVQWKSE
ncbi:MAG: hypothetical protein ACTSWJ_12585 [Candidatus Heimdallarchaeaceae archaeon]